MASLSVSEQERRCIACRCTIISDFWSFSILITELESMYAAEVSGKEPALPSLRASYADFVRQQKAALESDTGARAVQYWRGQLAPPLSPINLPLARQSSDSRNRAKKSHLFSLDPDLSSALRKYAMLNSTMSAALLAVFAVLMRDIQDKALPIATIPRADSAGDVIGPFVNTIIVW
jgi:hypothetical protein